MTTFTRITQSDRTFFTAAVRGLKDALVAHTELANGWTGRGRGCTALVTVEYQCAKPQMGVEGTITISINRGDVMRGEQSCSTGIRRMNQIVREELEAQELDSFFDLGRTESDDDFHTFTATFDMSRYSSADIAA